MMSPVILWVEVWLCVCLFPAVVLHKVTTRVSFFDNCGVLFKVDHNARYMLDMSDLLFPRGFSVCQLAFTRADAGEGGNGLLQCELASNSSASQDVTVILRSYVPDNERTYNSSHWISPNEQFDPAKRLVFTAIRSSTARSTQLHLTFSVFETVPLDGPWSLGSSVGYLFLACCVIGIVGVGRKYCRKTSAGNTRNNLFRDITQCITQIINQCAGRHASTESRAQSIGVGAGNSISTIPSSEEMDSRGSELPRTLPTIASDVSIDSFYDSPPSYEYCMANCNITRPELLQRTELGEQIFTLNSESPGCTCGKNSVIPNIDLSGEDELPPYSACVSILPPSHGDPITQQQDVPSSLANGS